MGCARKSLQAQRSDFVLLPGWIALAFHKRGVSVAVAISAVGDNPAAKQSASVLFVVVGCSFWQGRVVLGPHVGCRRRVAALTLGSLESQMAPRA